jgi:hypothetical protein
MTITLRPSHAYRWSNCAAAPTFEEKIPVEPDSDAAREGTAAAWVADCVLKGDAASAADLLGREHKNGWLVGPDMVEHVQGYIDHVRSRGGMTTSETFVRLNDFIAGTLDASTALSSTGYLYVTDLKYGFDIVDVFENVQLIIYGAAEMLRLMQAHPGWRPVKIELGIYQPRAFHPDGIYRTFTLTPEELWQRAQDLIERGARALIPNPVAMPGKHCRHCRAIGSCVAVAHTIYRSFQVVEDVRQKHLTGPELARELDFLDLMKVIFDARRKAIEAEGETRVRSGEYVPGWSIMPVYGHRKWTADVGKIHALTGINPIEQSTMTPAALERAGAGVEIVKKLAETPVVRHRLDRVTQRDIDRAFRKEK